MKCFTFKCPGTHKNDNTKNKKHKSTSLFLIRSRIVQDITRKSKINFNYENCNKSIVLFTIVEQVK